MLWFGSYLLWFDFKCDCLRNNKHSIFSDVHRFTGKAVIINDTRPFVFISVTLRAPGKYCDKATYSHFLLYM